LSEGFGSQIPGGEQPREESVGEAQYRLADWTIIALGAIGLGKPPRFYPFERDGLAKAWGPVLRRWPWLKTWAMKRKPPNQARVQALLHPLP
jgi:hypothetical protein